MKHVIASFRMIIFMTVVTGIAYPLIVTAIGQVVFHDKANGSIVRVSGVAVGSKLVAQDFEKPQYFWPRPSGVGYNPVPSGGTNLGPTSADLKKAFDVRRKKLMAANPDMGEPPQDLLFASGSGLDPDISPEAALYQLPRVAKARGIDTQQLQQIVEKYIVRRQFGFLGEPRVNVLALNLALDKLPAKGSH